MGGGRCMIRGCRNLRSGLGGQRCPAHEPPLGCWGPTAAHKPQKNTTPRRHQHRRVKEEPSSIDLPVLPSSIVLTPFGGDRRRSSDDQCHGCHPRQGGHQREDERDGDGSNPGQPTRRHPEIDRGEQRGADDGRTPARRRHRDAERHESLLDPPPDLVAKIKNGDEKPATKLQHPKPRLSKERSLPGVQRHRKLGGRHDGQHPTAPPTVLVGRSRRNQCAFVQHERTDSVRARAARPSRRARFSRANSRCDFRLDRAATSTTADGRQRSCSRRSREMVQGSILRTYPSWSSLHRRLSSKLVKRTRLRCSSRATTRRTSSVPYPSSRARSECSIGKGMAALRTTTIDQARVGLASGLGQPSVEEVAQGDRG